VATVLEEAFRIRNTDRIERSTHRLEQGLAGTDFDLSQEALDLGEASSR
jgi:hypothetical protein